MIQYFNERKKKEIEMKPVFAYKLNHIHGYVQ